MSGRVPIGAYGLIGDTRSAALVAPDGSIDWWCVPRFDDPPLFGRLVGGPEAGWFTVGPGETAAVAARAYRPDTVTLTTTWSVEGGELELADGLVAEVEGRFLPATVLVRRLSPRGRSVRARLHLVPRFGYERQAARHIARRGGALVCEHGDLAVAVTSDGPTIEVDRPVDFEVRPGEPVTIVVTVAHRRPLIVVPPAVAAAELARDEAGWRAWAAGIEVAEHRDAVVRSLITLQLLTYSPSGAPVAAPTTSLPERIGGDRNWDYRYAWPRDASIGIAAFLGAGKPQEARAFLAWLLHASRLSRPCLPVLFTLDGRPGPREAELAGWPGYADSRPVRIGNGAARQHQLDGYGWVVDAAWLLTDAGHAALRRDLAGRRRPGRPGRRHLDRTRRRDLGAAGRTRPPRPLQADGLAGPRPGDPHRRRPGRPPTIVASSAGPPPATPWPTTSAPADSTPPRAPTPAPTARPTSTPPCCFPLLEFEPATSPRVVGTVDAIRRRLGAGGPLLYRYPPGTDGLPAAKAPSCPARSGSSKRSPAPAATTKPKRCSTTCSPSAARSACTARRWTPPPASTSATTPRPSPTPPSSKRRSPSATRGPRTSARATDQAYLGCERQCRITR